MKTTPVDSWYAVEWSPCGAMKLTPVREMHERNQRHFMQQELPELDFRPLWMCPSLEEAESLRSAIRAEYRRTNPDAEKPINYRAQLKHKQDEVDDLIDLNVTKAALIDQLREEMQSMIKYLEAENGMRGEMAGSAVPVAQYQRWMQFAKGGGPSLPCEGLNS
jgi:hypothetical protein